MIPFNNIFSASINILFIFVGLLTIKYLTYEIKILFNHLHVIINKPICQG